MQILLKSLELKNFKGVKQISINFGEITTISGDNGTGKTSIMDSFMWLLFGKDSKDRKDYKIKTIDENGEELHGLEHSVIGELEVDGTFIKLERTYKERWTKQKGQAASELKGHTTDYFINDVPVQMKEYNEKVNDILADSTFKLITNPLYFTSLDWKKQREILLEIIGDIDSENIIAYKDSLKPLERFLGSNDIDSLRKQVKAKISKIKEQIKAIPNRIDECNIQIVDENFEQLELERNKIQKDIDDIDEQIADKSKGNEEKIKLQDYLYQVKNEYNTRLTSARNSANGPLDKLNTELKDVSYKVMDLNYDIEKLEKQKIKATENISYKKKDIKDKKKELQDLRDLFKEERETEFDFDDKSKHCPTCLREYEEEKLQEIKGNALKHFESFKKTKLNSINSRGKALGETIVTAEKKLQEDIKEIENYTNEIIELKDKVSVLEDKKKELEEKIENIVPGEVTFEGKEQLEREIADTEDDIAKFNTDNTTPLKFKKGSLQSDLREIDKLLAKKDNNQTLRDRIAELEKEEKDLSILQAELEGQDFLCEEYIRTKVELLEGNINKKFNGLSFKLFEQQINGGLTETCEALIDGVPFNAANTASQINAGLQIINTLCRHYNVTAPIFVDNSESVNKLEGCESQLIKLVVSLDKKLKMEVM